jgi:hypothetical protein
MGLNENDIKRVLWTGAQAFVAAVAVLAPGVFAAPNFSTAKALAVGAILAGAAAALSAVKNLLLSDSSSLK